MINFALIFFCISLGCLISRFRLVPDGTYKAINIWLIYAALPSLGLRYIPDIQWSISALLPSISPVIMWCGAFLFVGLYARIVKIDNYTKTALLIAMGISNSAFLGFPMIAAFFGEANIKYAIVFDQVTFIMFSTLVVSIVLKTHNGQKVSPKIIIKKLLRFPPFFSTLIALILSSFVDYSVLNPFFDKILATLSPLALFSIGLQLRLDNIRNELKTLSVGLLYKLVIAPAIILLLVVLLGERNMLGNVTVFEACMPAHITSSLLATQYGIRPDLCSMFVGVGIVISFFTTTLWYFVLQWI